ncbi:fibrinogen-like YCDxxxxGGGW domain-containing protein [Kineosporia babensis]|uniref:Fibrinogen C-terminal domain-containing protein n=1 Tax=Kineosporia babensis TaxID=499548 RepID=A0A9X1NJM0_9ACTN|nr:fibrinogen-like YCDxxxxGGGW domain-containing protein [Kineosporia babensis]MCD5315345.1 hypothetical protein [Kineosporia babensis]
MRTALSGRQRTLAGLLVTAMLGAALTVTAPIANAAVVRDGSSSAAAAASCYEIKQVAPTSPDGVYWLQTPTLVAPAQFYCDQTTDGGGWVLVGRGRDNWTFQSDGQGTPAEINATPSGTDAFTPVTLPAKTIDALLDGGRPDALTEGVRLKRARNVDGTTSQEVRFRLSNRSRWTWAINAALPITNWSMTATGNSGTGTASGNSASTGNWGSDQTWARVSTTTNSNENYRAGWAYGSSATGSTSDTSYIWKNSSSARAMPFTQVYLRPRLLSSAVSYPAITDSGTEASTQRAMADSRTLANPWGVGGLASGVDSVDTTEVKALAQVGNRMIVGGNFAYVQQDADGTGRVEQARLAAFDVDTGEWLDDFRPTLDGQVERLIALPNGNVVAGGNFSTVNGQAAPGIVALNPTTGATDTSWQVNLEQRQSSQPLYVRGLEISGGYLYIGGNFTHVSGGTRPTAVYSRSLTRVSASNGTPDENWRPEVLGNINAIEGSANGERVYVVGRFETINQTATGYFAVLSTADGAALVPGLAAPQFSNASSRYQQGVVEVGDKVYEGGAEHMMFGYDTATLNLASSAIAHNKGDFQVLTAKDGIVYASCHCSQWLYSGAKNWPSPTGWNQADNIEYIGAWDAATGTYLPEFLPAGVASRGKFGAWALEFDSNGVLWAGGDFVSGRNTNGTRVWTGAFMRFAPIDSTAPGAPADFTSRVVTNGLRLTWSPATDSSGRAVRYELIADDRVITTLNAATVLLDPPTETTRYFVRTIDRAGNRSASTPVLTYTP